jgi:hypothetical protein
LQPLANGDEVALLLPVAGGAAGPGLSKRRDRWQ